MKYFKRKEFACKCGCGLDTVDFELASILDSLREHFNSPVLVDSGCRCSSQNARIGGAKSSQHLLGRAADIKVEGHSPDEVADYLDQLYPNFYGIGRYNTWTHIDSRDSKARWDERTK